MNTSTRKVVGIDIDGVLADYVAALREIAAAHESLVLPEGLPTTYEMVEPGWFSDSEQWLRTHHLWACGHVHTTPLLDDSAARTMQSLRDAGHRVVIVTARGSGEGIEPDVDLVQRETRRWLDSNGLSHDGITFVSDKSTVEWDLLIDDSPGQVSRLHAAGRGVWVRDQPYNRSEELAHLPRAGSLEEFAHIAELLR